MESLSTWRIFSQAYIQITWFFFARFLEAVVNISLFGNLLHRKEFLIYAPCDTFLQGSNLSILPNCEVRFQAPAYFCEWNFLGRIIRISNRQFFTGLFRWQIAVIAVNFEIYPVAGSILSFAILAEVYNRYMSCVHAYSTAPILMTFTAYIFAFLSLKLVLIYISQIRLAGMVTCIFWVSQVVFTTEILLHLKHTLYMIKRAVTYPKNHFCIYMFTLETTKNNWYHRTLQIEGYMQNNKVTDLGQLLKQGSFYDLYVIQHSY